MSHSFKTILLLVALTGLMLAAGQWMGGREGLTVAFIFTLGMHFASYWWSDKIVLKMHRAVPMTRDEAPEIFAITEKLASSANIPMPKLYWIASASPNAFATGRSPKHAAVALTQGLVQSLKQEELQGVIAHELGHIIHRDTLTATMIATIAGTISYVGMMMRWQAMGFGARHNRNTQNPILILIISLLMPIAAAMIQLAVSRTREYAADDKGAELCGNPLFLASALQKISIQASKKPLENLNPAVAHLFIVSPLAGVDFAGLFATHPPVEKRIARLEAMAR